MKLYGRIVDEQTEAYTEVANHCTVVRYAYDEQPDGYLPVVVDHAKPEIDEDHRLVYHMYVRDGELHKDYQAYGKDQPLPQMMTVEDMRIALRRFGVEV